MDFKSISTGTRVTFDSPPPSHGRIKVWSLGSQVAWDKELRRAIHHKSTANFSVTETDWVNWGGRVYKEKPITPHQTIKALKQEIDALKDENENLKMKVQLLEAGN